MSGFTTRPLTPDRWSDLEELFGKSGPVEGCWCMFWRQKASEHDAARGATNKRRLKVIVEDRVPGLLAYDGKEPVGWCAVAPRTEYGRVERSRTLKPIDDQPVWSVVCFYIKKDHRHQGVARALLKGAVDFAVKHGAEIVEGYPVDPSQGKVDNSFAYTGVVSIFEELGFEEVARRSKARPVMRYCT